MGREFHVRFREGLGVQFPRATRLLSEEQFEQARQRLTALWAELPHATESRWEPFHYMTHATRHLGSSGGARCSLCGAPEVWAFEEVREKSGTDPRRS